MNAPMTLSQTDKTVQIVGKIAAIFGLLALALQFYINVTNSFNAGKGVMNVEEFDPDPFMKELAIQGLPWNVKELAIKEKKEPLAA